MDSLRKAGHWEGVRDAVVLALRSVAAVRVCQHFADAVLAVGRQSSKPKPLTLHPKYLLRAICRPEVRVLKDGSSSRKSGLPVQMQESA